MTVTFDAARQAALRQRFDMVVRHWIGLLGLLCLLGIGALAAWQGSIGEPPPSGATDCLVAAVRTMSTPEPCRAALRSIVESVAPSPVSRWTWEEPGWPRIFVWADNFMVACYTFFFIAVAGRSLVGLRKARGKLRAVSRAAFCLTILSILLGALADYIENFWLIAHIGSPKDHGVELNDVAWFSAWKFRLFTVNLLFVFGWALLAKVVSQSESYRAAQADKSSSGT